MRSVLAGCLLLLAGLNGLLAWSVDTCTQNSPDAPFAGYISLVLNILGFTVLAWKAKPVATLCAAAVPIPLAVLYSGKWLQLIGGAPACTILTGDSSWEPSGDEQALILLWTCVVLSFWLGLAFALWRGYCGQRPIMKQELDV